MLGTRGCKGVTVFLLFHPRYPPTQEGLAEGRGGCSATNAWLCTETCVWKSVCECVRECVCNCGMDLRRVVPPRQTGAGPAAKVHFFFYWKPYSLCSVGAHILWGLPLYYPASCAHHAPPHALRSTFIIKQSGPCSKWLSPSVSFPSVPSTRSWHELRVLLLRVVTRRTGVQGSPAPAGPQPHSCVGIFLGSAEGIINLSPCYFSAQPRGRLWPTNQLSTKWESQGRDTVGRKKSDSEGR